MKSKNNKSEAKIDASLRSRIKDVLLIKNTIGTATNALVDLFEIELMKLKKGLPE